MRTRAIFTALILATACAPALGCQIIAGITSLEVVDGGGGNGCHASGDCTNGDFCALMGDAGDAGGICQPPRMLGDSCTALDQCGAEHCTGGVCCKRDICPDNLACNAMGTACNTQCASSSDCAPGNVCSPGMTGMMGALVCNACGTAPPPMGCDGGPSCDTCDGFTCVRTCTTASPCSGMPLTIGSSTVDRLECGDQCNDISVTCVGANPCEIVCGTGCHNLHVNCSAMGGNCKLTCTDPAGCGGVVTMRCGDNLCDATCSGAQTVQQTPGGSCPPTKGTCK